ncbi:hypothetical protein FA13DRAFT_1123193 [Coprinellus micaceus]|uniref:Uncharacterized protein n=1 Tax=Coprinellus micaceus TaxID=71717 RepID=A0A4Y7SVS7_COPMI|nr:hypothetical protein FA13DRAFT_1123193 [Coprinellus micaceus]
MSGGQSYRHQNLCLGSLDGARFAYRTRGQPQDPKFIARDRSSGRKSPSMENKNVKSGCVRGTDLPREVCEAIRRRVPLFPHKRWLGEVPWRNRSWNN